MSGRESSLWSPCCWGRSEALWQERQRWEGCAMKERGGRWSWTLRRIWPPRLNYPGIIPCSFEIIHLTWTTWICTLLCQEGCEELKSLMTSLHGGHFSPGKPPSQEVFFRKEVFLMGRACLQMDSNRRKPQVHWAKFYLTSETLSSHQQILTRHDIPSGFLRSFWYSKENLEHCGCYKRMVVFS